jgi:hypothetical protein
MAPRAAYTAVSVIFYNGVRAYNPGDPVDAAVVEGPDAWVSFEDVEPSGVIPVERPARNASQAAWAAYAVSRGISRDEADGMSRAELIAATDDA